MEVLGGVGAQEPQSMPCDMNPISTDLEALLSQLLHHSLCSLGGTVEEGVGECETGRKNASSLSSSYSDGMIYHMYLCHNEEVIVIFLERYEITFPMNEKIYLISGAN